MVSGWLGVQYSTPVGAQYPIAFLFTRHLHEESLGMGFISDNVTLDDPAFIHESAWLYGKVYVGPGASIWPNVVTRAEFLEIRIGARTNIQDFVMIHVGAMTPTIVGEDCSITHHAILHGCDIGDRCLIGINATIMDGAKIGANSIVAGNSICLLYTSPSPRDRG